MFALNFLFAFLFFAQCVLKCAEQANETQVNKTSPSVQVKSSLFTTTTIVGGNMVGNAPKSTFEKALDRALDGLGLLFKYISKKMDEDD